MLNRSFWSLHKKVVQLFMLILILTSCIKKNDPQPTPSVTTLFSDNFSNNNNHWPQWSNDTSSGIIQSDSYIISCNLAGEGWDVWRSVQIDTNKNFSIKASFTWKTGVINYGYGLIWGLKDVNNHYTFEVNAVGYFLIYSKQNGNSSNIVNWTVFNSLSPATDVLEIVKNGKQYIYNVNGKEVFTSPFKPFFGNGVGFRVTNVQKVAVSSFIITQW